MLTSVDDNETLRGKVVVEGRELDLSGLDNGVFEEGRVDITLVGAEVWLPPVGSRP